MTAGSVRGIVVGSRLRAKALPDVPTLAEEYGTPGYEAGVWYGLLAPTGSPDEIVRYLADKLQALAAAGGLRQKIEAAGNELSMMGTPEFTAFIREDREKWEKVIDELGLKQLKL